MLSAMMCGTGTLDGDICNICGDHSNCVFGGNLLFLDLETAMPSPSEEATRLVLAPEARVVVGVIKIVKQMSLT